MKKGIMICLAAAAGFGLLISGCGSVKSEINVVPGQPTGLSIRGTVWSVASGKITGKVKEASVSLSGTLSSTVTTDADGNYVFENVNPGTYTVVVTKEGAQQGTNTGTFVDNASSNSVLTLDINLKDDPTLISTVVDKSTSPETVILTFSEAMDKSTVIASLSYDGVRAFGQVESSTNWSADGKILSVQLKGGSLAGSKYSLILAGPTGACGTMTDLNGNVFDPVGNTITYYNSTYSLSSPFTISLNVGGTETAPTAAPTNLKVMNSSGTTEIDYLDVNFSDSKFLLSWDGVTGAKAYKVYCSYNGGAYQFYGQSSANNNISVTPGDADLTLGDFQSVSAKEYDSSSISYPLNYDSNIKWPFIGSSAIDFKVIAVNSGGEGSASSIINIKDTKKPRVTSASKSWSSTTEVSVSFTEPLNKDSAENTANYTISGQTISKAELTNNYGYYKWGNYNFGGSSVKLTFSPGATSGIVEVSANIQDLSGNGVDPLYNKATFN